MKFITKTIHTKNVPDFKYSGDVVVPIHLATTFARKKVNFPTDGFEYSRTGNPTRYALEETLALIEHGQFAFAYSSGLAAETNILFLLRNGDHIVVIDDVYGGTRRLFTKVFTQYGLSFSFVDFSGTDGLRILKKAVNQNTKMIWVESPTNPLLKIVDIQSVSNFAKKKKIMTVVDNTFASPYFQNPLTLGADVVLHSATKYLGGHSDVVGGAVIVKSKILAQRIRFLQNAVGAVLSPFDSYLLQRGIKTLAVRMEIHQKNAFIIANFLQSHKKIRKVYYPGMESHKGYEIAKKQMTGYSGVVSFELKGDEKSTIKFIESLKLIHIAESLGAVESLIEHPASMTHASISKKEKDHIGISDELVRISVGIEDIDDLLFDLNNAFEKVK